MGQIFDAIAWLLQIFLFALIARLILDYVRVFRPQWRPQGVVLALAELVYTISADLNHLSCQNFSRDFLDSPINRLC